MNTPSELRKEANRHRRLARTYLFVCKILFGVMLTLFACSIWNAAEGSVKYYILALLCVGSAITVLVRKIAFHELKREFYINELKDANSSVLASW